MVENRFEKLATEIRPHFLWDIIKEVAKAMLLPAAYVLVQKVREVAWDWWFFGGLLVLSIAVLLVDRFVVRRGPGASGQETLARRLKGKPLATGGIAFVITLAVLVLWFIAIPKKAYVNIQARPGAKVSVDGNESGTVGDDGTLAIKVPPGAHQVEVELHDYYPWSEEVVLKSGERLPVHAALNFSLKSPVGERFELDEKELAAAKTDRDRFYALSGVAKGSVIFGRDEDARRYATELLSLAPRFQKDFNYGNAIQDGNLVLGRIAVREGHIDEAKRYLRMAGESPGSPQMDSFGPNMSLAEDLLEKGERQSVLDYFEACRKFWKMSNGRLDGWAHDVQAGKMPNFGPNLEY
jgi:hypothetical protein